MELLAEKKEQILAAIKDLDFEYKAGKLSEEDYQRVRAEDLAQVAQIMDRMQAFDSDAEPESTSTSTSIVSESESETQEARQPEAQGGPEIACSSCQQVNPSHAKFCLRCGNQLEIQVECPRCGAQLPDEAHFCISCGEARSNSNT
jgi:ribosomal protein L40E